MQQKTCIIIAGPTAVGKTSLAITLAQHFNTAIISADSRQCFRELDIGVAKPSPAQLQQVKHHFINTHAVTDDVNAGVFEQYALAATTAIFKDHDVAVMVGGTGLYIKAFSEGMDDMPPVAPEIRSTILKKYEAAGMAWLQKEVQVADPDYYAAGEIHNPQRLMRALEIKLSTGKSIRSFQQGQKVQRPFNIIKMGLDLPREDLYRNINQRVDDMMQQGLEQEVRSLIPFRHLNALQTVGYSELFDCFDGKQSILEAADAIKKNTRHYAKRQLTWFKKDVDIKWFSPLDTSQIITYLDKLV